MTYIVEDKRTQVDPEIDALYHALVGLEMDDDANDMEDNLNYVITRLFKMIYGDEYSTRYASINAAVGVLECVKLEMYRKTAAPYENQKEFENGSVVGRVKPIHTTEVVVEKA